MDVNAALAAIDSSLYRVAVRALIVDNHKLLLVKERDDAWWSTPGGGVEYGETLFDALLREIEEETGLKRDDIELTSTPILIESSGIVHGVPRINVYYKVTIIGGTLAPTKDVESFDWFDSGTITTILMSPASLHDLPKLLEYL